jgi:hypothetical protein
MNPACFFVHPRSPRSSAPCCQFPTYWPSRLPAPHAPVTKALPGHALPYPNPTPPCLGRVPVTGPTCPAQQRSTAAWPGPTSPGRACQPSAPPHPAARAHRPAQPCSSPAVGPAPPSSVCSSPGPAPPCLRCAVLNITPPHPAPPCPAHRVGGPSPPASAPPVRAELLFVLNFFLD